MPKRRDGSYLKADGIEVPGDRVAWLQNDLLHPARLGRRDLLSDYLPRLIMMFPDFMMQSPPPLG